MGIPSYFSYIIKNYTNIIRKFESCERFQVLLMDCNSVIYDSYYELENAYKKESFDISNIEERLIKISIQKIEDYIDFVSPTKLAYVTFDGVAPFAKMNQQRIRRYKTQFLANISKTGGKIWNTSSITPGTDFMEKLSFSVTKHFKKNKRPITVLTSCSNEYGEGEHKLFKYIRDNDCTADNVAVYGLDADLIMLSIFHFHLTKNIYVFREAPNFKTVISADYNVGEKLFMDIHALSNSIFQEMGTYPISQFKMRVHDYIFMCFLLGNDFLPHIACLNIRTHGMQILTDTYNITIGKYNDKSFIHPVTKTILWANVKLFLSQLAKHEWEWLLQDCKARDKWVGRTWPSNTPEEIDQLVLNVPMIYRQDEWYIMSSKEGYEKRYRKRLEVEGCESNYLDGLEWVYNYYRGEAVDFRWKYNYDYAPLLGDVIKHIYKEMKPRPIVSTEPFTPSMQMMYVMPGGLLEERKEYTWAFCRYIWEGHPKLPEIKML